MPQPPLKWDRPRLMIVYVQHGPLQASRQKMSDDCVLPSTFLLLDLLPTFPLTFLNSLPSLPLFLSHLQIPAGITALLCFAEDSRLIDSHPPWIFCQHRNLFTFCGLRSTF